LAASTEHARFLTGHAMQESHFFTCKSLRNFLPSNLNSHQLSFIVDFYGRTFLTNLINYIFVTLYFSTNPPAEIDSADRCGLLMPRALEQELQM
jgi:hypothetical protein